MCYNFTAKDYSRSIVQIKQTHTLLVIWWLHWLGRECVYVWEQKCISVTVHIHCMCFKSIAEYVCVCALLCCLDMLKCIYVN